MIWQIENRGWRAIALTLTLAGSLAVLWFAIDWLPRSAGLSPFLGGLLSIVILIALAMLIMFLIEVEIHPDGLAIGSRHETDTATMVAALRSTLRDSVDTIEEIEALLAERAQRIAEAEAELKRLETLGEVGEQQAAAILDVLREDTESTSRRSRRDAIDINAVFLGVGLALGQMLR